MYDREPQISTKVISSKDPKFSAYSPFPPIHDIGRKENSRLTIVNLLPSQVTKVAKNFYEGIAILGISFGKEHNIISKENMREARTTSGSFDHVPFLIFTHFGYLSSKKLHA